MIATGQKVPFGDVPSNTKQKTYGLAAWQVRQRNLRRRRLRFLFLGGAAIAGILPFSPLPAMMTPLATASAVSVDRNLPAVDVYLVGTAASLLQVAPEPATGLVDPPKQRALIGGVALETANSPLPAQSSVFDHEVRVPTSGSILPSSKPAIKNADRPSPVKTAETAAKDVKPKFAPFDLDAAYKDR